VGPHLFEWCSNLELILYKHCLLALLVTDHDVVPCCPDCVAITTRGLIDPKVLRRFRNRGEGHKHCPA
jgi:hypothetical protein